MKASMGRTVALRAKRAGMMDKDPLGRIERRYEGHGPTLLLVKLFSTFPA